MLSVEHRQQVSTHLHDFEGVLQSWRCHTATWDRIYTLKQLAPDRLLRSERRHIIGVRRLGVGPRCGLAAELQLEKTHKTFLDVDRPILVAAGRLHVTNLAIFITDIAHEDFFMGNELERAPRTNTTVGIWSTNKTLPNCTVVWKYWEAISYLNINFL